MKEWGKRKERLASRAPSSSTSTVGWPAEQRVCLRDRQARPDQAGVRAAPVQRLQRANTRRHKYIDIPGQRATCAGRSGARVVSERRAAASASAPGDSSVCSMGSPAQDERQQPDTR